MQLALGLIETKGLIGAIEAADAMAKAADVKVLNKEKSAAALITIKIVGEVAAVKSAVDAGSAAAQRVGQLLSAHVIPRPHEEIASLIEGTEKVITPETKKSKKKSPPTAEKNLFDDQSSKIPASEAKKETAFKEVKVEEVVTEAEAAIADEKIEETKKTRSKSSKAVVEEIIDIAEELIDEETEPGSEVEIEKSELKGIDHLKQLREEAKSELDFDEESSAEPAIEEQLTAEPETTTEDIPAVGELEKLNVHQLRKLARATESFPIKGREISKANRGTLLDYFRELK